MQYQKGDPVFYFGPSECFYGTFVRYSRGEMILDVTEKIFDGGTLKSPPDYAYRDMVLVAPEYVSPLQKGWTMGKDKKGDTARQDHKHNYDGQTRQVGGWIVVQCTCGSTMSRTWNPGGKS